MFAGFFYDERANYMSDAEFILTSTYQDGLNRYLAHIEEMKKAVGEAWKEGVNKCSYFTSILIMIENDRWLTDADKEMLKEKTHEAWKSISESNDGTTAA